MKIAFLDTIGLTYNGNTLDEKGLGGSESAIILLTKELTKIGFNVTVYCRCDKPGTYDNVKYVNLVDMHNIEDTYDILVSSRSVLPFAPDIIRNDIIKKYNTDISWFKELVSKSKYKVLWMHDTFCSGDEYIQDLLADGYFNEIFTLSDWHATYVATAFHNNVKRFPEFLKNKMFYTRNGIVNYGNDIDISKKDKNLFVFNASISKGMKPLLDEVWSSIINKTGMENARLKVIGGYYDFVDNDPDSFKNQFETYKEKYNGKDGIEFTGIIKQSEIAEILKEASYFLYPNIYPETFGISVTEAINYNCLLIGFNFGALEEIAPESTSYQTEFHYGYRDISKHSLVRTVISAYHNDYLRQQKQYACNAFKPFLGWDVVALQWKHHFYRKLNKYLPIEETRTHRYNIGNINHLYKKKMINNEEYFEDYSHIFKNTIVVVSPVYNAESYIKDHILSVASQNYYNYVHIIVDDISTDNTYNTAKETIENLPKELQEHFQLVSATTKNYAVGNQVEVLNNIILDCMDTELLKETIVVLLDGDDTLVNDPDVFNYINRLHIQGAKFTYGSCYSVADKINLIAQPYPLEVIKNKTFRQHKFNWGIPYTHLRTFRLDLYNQVDQTVFKDTNGEYWKCGGDNATFYPLIELCQPNEIQCVQRVLVNYNDINPLNDYKVNSEEQNTNAKKIIEGKK